eukprot:2274083-Amphidinium_carterae.3
MFVDGGDSFGCYQCGRKTKVCRKSQPAGECTYNPHGSTDLVVSRHGCCSGVEMDTGPLNVSFVILSALADRSSPTSDTPPHRDFPQPAQRRQHRAEPQCSTLPCLHTEGEHGSVTRASLCMHRLF